MATKQPMQQSFVETPVRTVAKTLSWRIVATSATIGLVWALSGRWELALGVGATETVMKTALYFLHERAWNRVNLGRVRAEEGAAMGTNSEADQVASRALA